MSKLNMDLWAWLVMRYEKKKKSTCKIFGFYIQILLEPSDWMSSQKSVRVLCCLGHLCLYRSKAPVFGTLNSAISNFQT